MAKLGDLGLIITGNTPKTSDAQNYATDDICFAKPSDIADGTITHLADSEFYISEYARSKARVLPPKCILVTCIGVIGKVAINDVECAFNQQINAIVPNKNMCIAEYVAYAIQSKQAEIQDIANAPVVPIINKTQFSNIEIPIPSLEVQKDIVSKLDKISNVIALRKEQLAKLDRLVKSRFMELFGEGQYPKAALIDLIKEGAGLSYGIVQPGDDGTGDMGVLRPVDMVDGKISTASIKYIDRSIGDGFKKTELTGDELLITVRGTTGITALTDSRFAGMNVTRGIAVIRYDPNKINPVYLNAYLNTDESQRYIQEHTRGATLQQINLSDLRIQEIIVPPKEQQEQMAVFVAQTDKSKSAIQQSLGKLELLKKSLMQEYFG